MDECISRSDALDILDQFEDAVENGEHFYEQARKLMIDLPDELASYREDLLLWLNDQMITPTTKYEQGQVDTLEWVKYAIKGGIV